MLIKRLEPEYLDEVRHYGLDVVTLDGEQRSGKGVMCGGYYSSKVKKIELLRQRKDLMRELDERKGYLAGIEDQLSQILAELRVKLEEKDRLETKGDRVANTFKNASSKLSELVMYILSFLQSQTNYLHTL